MSHIFICYSHKDKEYVRKIHQHLFEQDFDVWIDDRLDYGSRWNREIERRIKECSAFIVVMSENSYGSTWVQEEVDLARKLKKPIFPLLLKGDVWWFLRDILYVDVRDGKLPPSEFLISLLRYKAFKVVTKTSGDSLEQKNRFSKRNTINWCKK